MKRIFTLLILIMFVISGYSQFVSKYPDIPRIDVHTHIGNDYNTIESYLKMRDVMLHENSIDLAMILNLNDEQSIDTVFDKSQGRILTALNDYEPHKGISHRTDDIFSSLEKGMLVISCGMGLLKEY